MQAANRAQKALKSGSGVTFGAWQMLPGTSHTRTIARCGFDWQLVDTEHGNIDDGAMHEAVATIAACGVSPIVRIVANESWIVKRALDSGAHGIIVPLLHTADDATRLVRSAKFPPVGSRGFGSPFAMERFGSVSQTEYLRQANDALITIVQIETKEALANVVVDAIAKVPGIDCLFVGVRLVYIISREGLQTDRAIKPFDLGNNIGHPILDGVMSAELKNAISKVLQVAKENGKSSGIYSTSGDQAREFADQGFNMISAITDMVALPAALTSHLMAAKGSYVHSALSVGRSAVSGLGKLAYGESEKPS